MYSYINTILLVDMLLSPYKLNWKSVLIDWAVNVTVYSIHIYIRRVRL